MEMYLRTVSVAGNEPDAAVVQATGRVFCYKIKFKFASSSPSPFYRMYGTRPLHGLSSYSATLAQRSVDSV